MANATGYEELSIGSQPVGPTASLVKVNVACAMFYVDPKAAIGVRWKPNAQSAADYPSSSSGLPIAPGKWITVAGEGVIRNSKFVQDGQGGASPTRIYVIYFDRVDVVAADFASGFSEADESKWKRMEELLNEILIELRKHTDALNQVVEDPLEPVDET